MTSPADADTETRDAEKVARAVNATLAGDIESAKTLLTEVIANAPEIYEHQFEGLGTLFIKFWDQNEFVHYVSWQRGQSAEKFVSWIPSAYPRVYFYLGFIAVKEGEYQRAIEYLDRGHRLEPSNPKFNLEKAQAYLHLGQHQQALALYDAVNTLGPFTSGHDRAAALRGRGFVLIEIGDLGSAEQAFRASLELEPDSAVAHNELGYIAHLRAGGGRAPLETVTTTAKDAGPCVVSDKDTTEGS